MKSLKRISLPITTTQINTCMLTFSMSYSLNFSTVKSWHLLSLFKFVLHPLLQHEDKGMQHALLVVLGSLCSSCLARTKLDPMQLHKTSAVSAHTAHRNPQAEKKAHPRENTGCRDRLFPTTKMALEYCTEQLITAYSYSFSMNQLIQADFLKRKPFYWKYVHPPSYMSENTGEGEHMWSFPQMCHSPKGLKEL